MLADGGRYRQDLTVTVYTDEKCAFCGQALEVVRQSAERLRDQDVYVNIVVQQIDWPAGRAGTNDIRAIPAIRVGSAVLTGIPTHEELENVIHSYLLTRT
ncbi:MAG: hypothetical protein QXS20_05860 [Candidatus Thorarchaeota archaeon]